MAKTYKTSPYVAIPLSVSLLVSITSCTVNGRGDRQATGAIVGGVAGGLLGSQIGEGHGKTAATIGGAVIGAMIGGAVGQSMDQVDRMKMARVMETSRTGSGTTWINPDTQTKYTVVPTRTTVAQSTGQPCRDYKINAIIGGKEEVVYGRACRAADGSWTIVR